MFNEFEFEYYSDRNKPDGCLKYDKIHHVYYSNNTAIIGSIFSLHYAKN
jgi:hypothetical protein